MRLAPELAEAIGTFALVFAACGAIMVDSLTGAIGHLGIALAFGLVISAMIYAVGHVSGAHFNPAVTIAFAATGHFPPRRVATYIAAQITGAVAGALALLAFVPDAGTLGETAPMVGLAGWQALVIEILITATLMFVIAAVATDGRAVGTMAGNAIGATVALGALWAGPLTGASMNPARSLGPALVGDGLASIGIYLAGPIIGALVGAKLYELTRKGARPEAR